VRSSSENAATSGLDKRPGKITYRARQLASVQSFGQARGTYVFKMAIHNCVPFYGRIIAEDIGEQFLQDEILRKKYLCL
jgi:hypothetical protein